MTERRTQVNTEKINARGRGFLVLLVLLVLLAVLISGIALFTGKGPFADRLTYGRNPKMFLEIGIWVLILISLTAIGRRPARQFLLFAIFAIAVLYLHVIILPAIVSGLYLAGILFNGRIVRKMLRFGDQKFFTGHLQEGTDAEAGEDGARGILPEIMASDFILGSCFLILVVCALSLLHIGKIRLIQVVTAGLMAAGGLWFLRDFRQAGGKSLIRGWQEKADRLPKRRVFEAAFLLLIFLIQAARMNRGQDYDSLWYGLRSAYILTVGGGIYDDPGMVGMVYVYSKGFEVLTLSLTGLRSYAYLFFFNLTLTMAGIFVTYRLASRFMNREAAHFAAILSASVPAIINMGITAKTDTITWLCELMMADFFFAALEASREESGKIREQFFWLMTIGTYLFTLTLKPTALVFSTAVFGMMGLWLIATRRLKLRMILRRADVLLFPLLTLIGIWGRTWKLTGMPVMSVFTTIFEKLGFRTKYPFISTAIPSNYEEENPVTMLIRRIGGMLLAPVGEDMAHVHIAWGSSLVFVMLVFLLVFGIARLFAGRRGAGTEGGKYPRTDISRRRPDGRYQAAVTILVPFALVNLVSLLFLYQVDGNYFMLFISAAILVFAGAVDRFGKAFLRVAVRALIPLLILNTLIISVSSWSGSDGFSRIRLVNTGRINDKAVVRQRFVHYGCEAIYDTLAADKENRALAFAYHPYCLQIPCVIQSYKELFYPWGDDSITESPESITRYLRYAKIRYVYVEATYMGNTQYPWAYDMVRDLIKNGTLKLDFLQNGNALLEVTPEGEPVPADQAAENLHEFDRVYARTDRTEWIEKTWIAVMRNYESEFR